MTADQLAQLLDELGKRLGPAGQHVFDLTLRQIYIEAGLGLVTAIVAVLLTLAWVRPIWRWANAPSEDSYSISDRPFVAGMLGILWGIVLIALLAMALFVWLPMILNPEYAALQRIVQVVKP